MIVKINVMKRYETLIVVCRGHFLYAKSLGKPRLFLFVGPYLFREMKFFLTFIFLESCPLDFHQDRKNDAYDRAYLQEP